MVRAETLLSGEEFSDYIRWAGMGALIKPPNRDLPDIFYLGQQDFSGLKMLTQDTLSYFADSFNFSPDLKNTTIEALDFTVRAYDVLTRKRDEELKTDPTRPDVRRKSGEVYSTHKLRVLMRSLGFLGAYAGDSYVNDTGFDIKTNDIAQQLVAAGIVCALWHDFIENRVKYEYLCEMSFDNQRNSGSFRVEDEPFYAEAVFMKLVQMGLEALTKPQIEATPMGITRAKIDKIKTLDDDLQLNTQLGENYRQFFILLIEAIKAADRMDNLVEMVRKINGQYLPFPDQVARNIVETTAAVYPNLEDEFKSHFLLKDDRLMSNAIHFLFSPSLAAITLMKKRRWVLGPPLGFPGEESRFTDDHLNWYLSNNGKLFSDTWQKTIFDLGDGAHHSVTLYSPPVWFSETPLQIYNFGYIAGKYRSDWTNFYANWHSITGFLGGGEHARTIRNRAGYRLKAGWDKYIYQFRKTFGF